ncbi:DUF1905 domain-containing protein [Brumimicrobium glaciale]|uniref:DUF1905 domain-containing protein n=1 Tax=Brumimicrobium glaciale TaxID=200475 RepID=A0A4Q4KES6_9FLAO|nr:YdeI/OmpD-associated family protein [Brumimicrobium glaciale]RYM31445.1 DUF1905 domain-containing protein [Brumimicrobium glaciale]
MRKFKAKIEIIGINPFVFVPLEILNTIFEESDKNKGIIPVRGTVNGKQYQQTLLRYSGEWRLYINMVMLKDSPKRIGELIEVEIEFDPNERTVVPHPKLTKAFKENKEAFKVFEGLTPSSQKEIVKYISFLKTEASIDMNVKRAINYLLGNERFIGRDTP